MSSDDLNEQPLWPRSVRDVMKDKYCTRCNARIRPQDIIGVGSQMLLTSQTTVAGPAAFVIVYCPTCQKLQTRLGPPTRAEVIEAITQLYVWGDRLAAARRHDRPDADEDEEPEDDEEDEKPLELSAEILDRLTSPPPVRPSIRQWQPRHPFGEAEIRVFLNKLKAASFKVGTKSLRRFLKRFGIDPDQPPEADQEPVDPDKPPF